MMDALKEECSISSDPYNNSSVLNLHRDSLEYVVTHHTSSPRSKGLDSDGRTSLQECKQEEFCKNPFSHYSPVYTKEKKALVEHAKYSKRETAIKIFDKKTAAEATTKKGRDLVRKRSITNYTKKEPKLKNSVEEESGSDHMIKQISLDFNKEHRYQDNCLSNDNSCFAEKARNKFENGKNSVAANVFLSHPRSPRSRDKTTSHFTIGQKELLERFLEAGIENTPPPPRVVTSRHERKVKSDMAVNLKRTQSPVINVRPKPSSTPTRSLVERRVTADEVFKKKGKIYKFIKGCKKAFCLSPALPVDDEGYSPDTSNGVFGCEQSILEDVNMVRMRSGETRYRNRRMFMVELIEQTFETERARPHTPKP